MTDLADGSESGSGVDVAITGRPDKADKAVNVIFDVIR